MGNYSCRWTIRATAPGGYATNMVLYPSVVMREPGGDKYLITLIGRGVPARHVDIKRILLGGLGLLVTWRMLQTILEVTIHPLPRCCGVKVVTVPGPFPSQGRVDIFVRNIPRSLDLQREKVMALWDLKWCPNILCHK